MEFEFDPAKAAGNLRKHGVSFADAEGVFADPLALHRADPDAEGEERSVAVGEDWLGQVMVVVYTFAQRSHQIDFGSSSHCRRETHL